MKHFRLQLGERELYEEFGLIAPGFVAPMLSLTTHRAVIVRAPGSPVAMVIADIARATTVVPTEIYGDAIVIASNDPAVAPFAFRSAAPRALIARLADWVATTPAQPLPGARVIPHH